MNYLKLTKQALILSLSLMLLAACSSPAEKQPTTENQATTTVVNPDYEIASQEYSELAAKALTSWSKLDFESWTSMMSDDVVFYFPDGDSGTRTELAGKQTVLDWWNNWEQTSGIQSMTYKDHIDIPVNAKNTLPYSGLSGIMVLSYFSNESIFNGNPINLRMNVVVHFNSNKQIDRVYTYYDRTKIVEEMNENILDKRSK
jgi:hypothetical protein